MNNIFIRKGGIKQQYDIIVKGYYESLDNLQNYSLLFSGVTEQDTKKLVSYLNRNTELLNLLSKVKDYDEGYGDESVILNLDEKGMCSPYLVSNKFKINGESKVLVCKSNSNKGCYKAFSILEKAEQQLLNDMFGLLKNNSIPSKILECCFLYRNRLGKYIIDRGVIDAETLSVYTMLDKDKTLELIGKFKNIRECLKFLS